MGPLGCHGPLGHRDTRHERAGDCAGRRRHVTYGAPGGTHRRDRGVAAGQAHLGWPRRYWLVRAVYILTRGIPELVWAMLLLFVFAPGMLPGALALGIHNLGIVGRLCAEVVEDLNPRPIQALRTSGATSAQVVLYGVLPQVLPQFLTCVVYRWEVIIRTTIVVGFVSAGGLGREFRLAMSYFHYTDIALILLVYVLLVIAVNLIGAGLRRLAV
ncbi:MAG: ABC transporter permease subunit [Dehalococcoidia bacterium]|nr:ABC transporter permease subunit [Dehalococcoidia bacterium]